MSIDQSDFTTFEGETPEGACVRYEVCGNIVPADGQICGDCSDELRAADREERGDEL